MSELKHLDSDYDPEFLKRQDKRKKLQDEKQAKYAIEKNKIYEDEILPKIFDITSHLM